jgi:hypothetical protein
MEEWRCSSIILNLGTRWIWVTTFMPCRFTAGKKPPAATGYESGWPRAYLDAMEMRKISSLCQELNPDSSVIRSTAYPSTLVATGGIFTELERMWKEVAVA